MTLKKLILLNFFWATIAICAFFYRPNDEQGQKWFANRGVDDTKLKIDSVKEKQKNFFLDPLGNNSKAKRLSELADDLLTGPAGLSQAFLDIEASRAQEEEQLKALVKTVTPETALSMLEIFNEIPRSEMTDRVFLEFLRSWGKVAGPEAATLAYDSSTWSKSVNSRWGVAGSLESVMAGWASVDPATAIEFSRNFGNQEKWDSRRADIHLGIIQELQRWNLEDAISYSQDWYSENWEDYASVREANYTSKNNLMIK